jgi:glycosyltransferase involved in cell wall biosynthesis
VNLSRVEAVIPARNEERYLRRTLEALAAQTLRLDRLIVVNDGSTDATYDIALAENCMVIDIPSKHGPREKGSPALAGLFNVGLDQVSVSAEYVVILGADHILPDDYVERVIKNMKRDNVSLASGVISNEPRQVPRGSGRIVKTSVWRKLMGRLAYPPSYGFETYLVLRMQKEGHNVAVYPDIRSHVQRKTGAETDYVSYGRAMKFLGYTFVYMLGRALVSTIRFRNPAKAVRTLVGYVTYQERSDLADYLSKAQRKLLLAYVRNPRKILARINT